MLIGGGEHPTVLLRVDQGYVESLRSHLVDEGFPATRVAQDALDVLFPASPPVFAAAVELDDWLARVGSDVTVRIEA